jgi:hypothetical protein
MAYAILTLCIPATPPAAVVGRTHELRIVTSPWAEMGVTWNNQPAVSATSNASWTVPATAQCVSADVRADVQAWVSGEANYGWRINDQVEAIDTSAPYSSREEINPALRPSLSYAYNP